VGLDRGPLSLVSITEELLEWEISGSGSRKSRLINKLRLEMHQRLIPCIEFGELERDMNLLLKQAQIKNEINKKVLAKNI
jgi:hypothetical protein